MKLFLPVYFALIFLGLNSLAGASTGRDLLEVGKLVQDVMAPAPKPRAVIFAVAPFHTNDPTNTMGTELGQKMTSLLKSMNPNISLAANVPAATSAEDAQKIMETNGIDWMVWGTEEPKQNGVPQWTFGFCVSDRFEAVMRQAGMLGDPEISLHHIPAEDISVLVSLVLKDSTLSMQAISQLGSTQKLPDQIAETKAFIDKIEKKKLDPAILRFMKNQEAVLLFTEGMVNDDEHSKHLASKTYKELLEGMPETRSEEKASYEYQLGLLEGFTKNPAEAVSYLKKALADVDATKTPKAALYMRFYIGINLVAGAEETVDMDELQEGIEVFEKLIPDVDKKTQLDIWVNAQMMLGDAYHLKGSQQTDNELLKASKTHLLAALAEAKSHMKPQNIALLETTLADTYSSLGFRNRDVDQLQGALVTAEGAVAIYRSLGNKTILAVALTKLSEIQTTLGVSTDDLSLLQKAKTSLEESQGLVSKKDNPRFWAANQVTLADIDKTLASKLIDAKIVQMAFDDLAAAKEVYPELENNPAYYSMDAQLNIMRGSLACDDKAFDKALADVTNISTVVKLDKNPLLGMQLNGMKANIFAGEGYFDRNPVQLRMALSLDRGNWDAFANSPDADNRCTVLADLADIYHDLFFMNPTPEDVAGARWTLAQMKDCKGSRFAPEAFVQLLGQTELTYSLGRFDKDEKVLREALTLGEANNVYVEKYASPFEKADQMELMGQIELALWEISKKPEDIKKAQELFTSAQAIFKNANSCLGRYSTEGLEKIEAYQSGK